MNTAKHAAKPAPRHSAVDMETAKQPEHKAATAHKKPAETRADHAEKTLSPDQERLAKGEHIEQKKPDMHEAMAAGTGPNATLESVGEGSVTELAPAVRSAMSDSKQNAERIVHQGDEVIVHGRAIVDGQTSMHGLVLKVNADGSIAVRVQRANGQTFDVPGKVHNADQGTGENWWTWPAEETLADQRKRA